jgi:hypothetical protein
MLTDDDFGLCSVPEESNIFTEELARAEPSAIAAGAEPSAIAAPAAIRQWPPGPTQAADAIPAQPWELPIDELAEQAAALEEVKANFYRRYGPTFSEMKNSSLVTEEKYQEIVRVMKNAQRHNKNTWTQQERRYLNKYTLATNVESNSLFRNEKRVSTYEKCLPLMTRFNMQEIWRNARNV